MHTESSPNAAITLWESGRLAARAPKPRFVFGRNHWIGAVLLLLAVLVFGLYVRVLERDVQRAQAQRDSQRADAVAEARCEVSTPGPARDACLARFDVAAAEAAAEGGHAEDGSARSFVLSTASVSTLIAPAP